MSKHTHHHESSAHDHHHQGQAQPSAANHAPAGDEADVLSAEENPDAGTMPPMSVADLMKLQGETDRFKDLALRAQADFENYRKRAAREKEEGIRYANIALLERLLPIIDNFELGLAAAKVALDQDSGQNSSTAVALVSGMSMVQKQLEDFLKENGVEVIDSVGKPFDPHVHEALGHQPCEKTPEGHVVRELRRGYKIRERLLRPSNVFVASPPVLPGDEGDREVNH